MSTIRFHAHALDRLRERGADEEEVRLSIEEGERFLAKHGRVGFRRNFRFESNWKGKHYSTKQVEVYCVEEEEWLVITVLVK